MTNIKQKTADLFYNYGVPLEGSGEWDEAVFAGCVRLRADIAVMTAKIHQMNAEITKLTNEVFRLQAQLDYLDKNMGGYN